MKYFNYLYIIFSLISVVTFGQINIISKEKKTQVSIQSGYLEKKPEFPNAIIYTKDPSGQVYIVHEGVEMWCDQAFVYTKDNFVNAYGNVLLKQGDSITMQSTYAEYNGNTQFAFASGHVVFKNPNSTLKTDTLYFDRIKQQAFFRSGGTVEDTASILTSRIGRYFAKQKKYQFIENVTIKNPKYTVHSQQLDFYSETGGAYLYGKSTIVSDASTIYCERGYYNTRNNTGYFVKNSRIDYNNRILLGDSIYFDRAQKFASATNNIKVIDTLNKTIINGHYAEVFRAKDSVFITKRPVAISIKDGDSIYVHADTLQVTGKPKNRIIKGFYEARMFKKGLKDEQPTSGKCDSIYVNQKTGITKLLTKPILWSGLNQITGDTITISSNTKTEKLDTLKVYNNAFLAQKDSAGYNQIKGEKLLGLFSNNQLDTVHIIKNTQVIFYSRNDKNELVGIDNTVCSKIEMYLSKQQITGIKFFKKVTGKLNPPSKFPENARLLQGFKWRGEERLQNPKDLFLGKPKPILTKIKGIPLPKDAGDFFDNLLNKNTKIPEGSKLKPKDLTKNPKDPKPKVQPDTITKEQN